ncbi:Neutral and basic amino acid transport protein rBAT [Lonchura striata]|uniref:Amino acid transporter heavy chain SLC3A1 n=1 Tax=Lonchura striata TaxID=40157 RepID=A0A218UU88_9PASE|nr:Neutral and basic amino acid transport protein rBAT [Lonchura striata domestica]
MELSEKRGVQNNGFVQNEDFEDKETDTNSQEEMPKTCSVDVEPVAVEETVLKPYAGMPKEVLLQFSSQARYRVTREILFWLVIAGSVVLVCATIAIIALSPKCLDWWQASPIYQIYPRSFRDSNMDGNGDLKGIQEKLDHITYLNIKTIWITSFFKSPLKDLGYGAEDFYDIDPIFGSMTDFENLIAAIHDRGLKVIMDLIPNHTSDKHRWFQLSRNRTGQYTDYYIWQDCRQAAGSVIPPNNWVSVFGNSSWQFDDVRKQCYFHQFGKEQPDLNFRNPAVQQEIRVSVKLTVNLVTLPGGASTKTLFSCGAGDHRQLASSKVVVVLWSCIKALSIFPAWSEATAHAPDGLCCTTPCFKENITAYSQLYHDYTTTQVGLHDIIRSFRHTMDEFSREPGRYRFMGSDDDEKEDIKATMMYYGTTFIQEADFPFNFNLINMKDLSGNSIFEAVNSWMKNMPAGKWPNWAVGSPNAARISTRVGKEYINVMNMLLLTLPGTPVTYYGEEIGMENIASENPTLPEKSPMQWDGEVNAGFTEGNSSWLPVNSDYQSVNVETQSTWSNSTLSLYRALTLLRNNELPMNRGWMCHVWNDSDVFVYVRELDGLDRVFMMVLNFGQKSTTDLQAVAPNLPSEAVIRLSTHFGNAGKVVNTKLIKTEMGEGLVLEYKTTKPVHTMEAFQGKCFVAEKACYSKALNLLYMNC